MKITLLLLLTFICMAGQAAELKALSFISTKEDKSLNSIFYCLLSIESNFKVGAISSTGDYGIGQVNKRSWPEVDYNRVVSDVQYSLEVSYNIFSSVAHKLNSSKQNNVYPLSETHWICAYNIGVAAYKRGSKISACKIYVSKINKCLARRVYG